MKYNLIEIKRNIPLFSKEPYRVCYDNSDDVDRVSQKEYFPHSLGFFHYPRTWKPKKAFQILKDHMIEERQNRIDQLMLDIEELKNVKLPDWIK